MNREFSRRMGQRTNREFGGIGEKGGERVENRKYLYIEEKIEGKRTKCCVIRDLDITVEKAPQLIYCKVERIIS